MKLDKRLSPAEFAQMLKDKGWSLSNAAFRWGVSLPWLSRVKNDPNRDLGWDDRVRGIPAISERERKALQEQRKQKTR